MKIKIGIWGSCVTRDIFRSVFNNYDEYFEINSSLERVSLISLMDNGNNIEFNDEDIQIYPINDRNKVRSKILEYDLSKNYLDIIGNDIDYLIIDEFFEAFFGVININGTHITNNFWDYPDTRLYETINKHDKLTLNQNFLEYYALWKNCCDEFFIYFHKHFPNVKIILNKVKLTSKVLKNDNSYYVDDEFQKYVEIYNPLIRLLETYLEKNHDVMVVDCTDDVIVNENHIWGKGFVNYCDEFYVHAFEKILDIINKNQINNKTMNNHHSNNIVSQFEFNSNDDVNVIKSPADSKLTEYLEIKKYLFEEASVNTNFIDLSRLKDYFNYISINNYENPNIDIQEMSFNELIKINKFVAENKEFLDEETKQRECEINSQYFDENAEFLIKYLESRIDIKNYGNASNNVVLLNSNDLSLNITQPSWFNDETGIGNVIRSVNGDLNLSFKCVNDGRLVIGFKSIDFKDKSGNRVPIYIDYSEIVINDNVIVDGSHVSWHDSPFIFEKEVEDGEIININVKWNPMNYNSNIFLDTDYEKLISNFYSARIDVKNIGNEKNGLILIDCDDDSSQIYNPDWFKDGKGTGTVVSSTTGNINMSFKCVNDGMLEINFRSMDLMYKNNRIPIFVEYDKIRINDEDIIEESVNAWHDDPFVYRKKVKNDQIITIQTKWNSLTGNSHLPMLQKGNNFQKSSSNSNDEIVKKLKNELIELNKENNELNKIKLEILSSNSSKRLNISRKIKNLKFKNK